MAENNENNRNDRGVGRVTVNRPVVSVGRIKKNSVPEKREENSGAKPRSASAEEATRSRVNGEEQSNPNKPNTSDTQTTLTTEQSSHAFEEGQNREKSSVNNEVKEVKEKNTLRSVGAKLRDESLHLLHSEKNTSAGKMLECGNIDIPLLMIFIVLIIYGIIMVFSASYAYAYIKEDNSYAFVKRQIFYLLGGIVCAGLIIFFYDKLLNWKMIPKAVLLYFAGAILLLVLIFVPGLGIMEGITRRWLNLGFISIQPSEFAKGALILMLAFYYDRYEHKINRLKKNEGLLLETIIPYCIAMVVVFLVFAEMHLSGTIILGLIAIIMVFTGEKHHKFTLIVLAVGLLIVALVIGYLMQFDTDDLKENAPGILKKILTNYSWERIEAWLDPGRFNAEEELWQTTQGLNAIGSGGFMGVGFGQSRQKHLFVSQPQNDFVFTIVCEEMGFVGGAIVIVLFMALILRGYVVGKRIPDTFSRLAVWGLCVSIGMQAFLNMGVVTALLPNTGISLPFFSYGGSSIISLMIEVGIILALSRYARKEN